MKSYGSSNKITRLCSFARFTPCPHRVGTRHAHLPTASYPLIHYHLPTARPGCGTYAAPHDLDAARAVRRRPGYTSRTPHVHPRPAAAAARHGGGRVQASHAATSHEPSSHAATSQAAAPRTCAGADARGGAAYAGFTVRSPEPRILISLNS